MLAVLATPVNAQDTHYWTQQYGTRAQLLGGAVVGSFLDLSATFYNPGTIALMENPDVLLSANAFELVDIKVDGESDAIEPLSNTRFGPAPSLFTGLFPSSWLRGQLAYSALTRQEFKVRLNRSVAGEGMIAEYPDSVDYSAEFYSDQDMGENWFGATWSNKISPTVGFGGTMYVAYRGQRTRIQKTINAVADNGYGMGLDFTDAFSYSHFRLVWKFGLAWDDDPVTLGVAITTPSVGLFGWGDAYFNRSIIGMDVDGDGQPDSRLLADSQQDLEPDYRSPFSIAAGGSYRWGHTSLHVSAEWFNSVDHYDVLNVEPIPTDIPGVSIKNRVSQELTSVFNMAFGVQHVFNKTLTGYLSFLTDRSAAVPSPSTQTSVTEWDLYHVSTGAAFIIAGLDLTAGVQYARGASDVQVAYIPELEEEVDIPENLQLVSNVTYQRMLFIIGFSFSL